MNTETQKEICRIYGLIDEHQAHVTDLIGTIDAQYQSLDGRIAKAYAKLGELEARLVILEKE